MPLPFPAYVMAHRRRTANMAALSRVFQCPELRQLICKQIGDDDKRTLFRLSLTCKSFTEPALDELWYKLDDFAPLVYCMPKDLWEGDLEWIDPPGQKKVTLSFQRLMLPSDWKSFETAAARVRIIEPPFVPSTVHEFDPNIFRSLTCAAQGRTGLLPRLRKLTWETSNDDIYPFIFLFLAPTITTLNIRVATGNIASDRMRFSSLGSLVSQCPSVGSMKLRASGRSRNTMPTWADLFSGQVSSAFALFGSWRDLSSLSFVGMELCTLIDAIAELPTLTKLELFSCRATNLSASSVNGFHALQHLKMNWCDMDSWVYVLTRMSCAPVVRLVLYLDTAIGESRWDDLFGNLQNGISRDSLTTISFSVLYHWHSVISNFRSILPLLHFRHISEFWNSGGSRLNLNEKDITHVAKAWPHLKSFRVRNVKKLSLRSLIPFAKHCPELEVLAMEIDATIVVDGEKIPRSGRFDSRLRRLDLFPSPIDDPTRVAMFISDIFPNVTEISPHATQAISKFSIGFDQAQKWQNVEKLIPVFAAVRRQEASRYLPSRVQDTPKGVHELRN